MPLRKNKSIGKKLDTTPPSQCDSFGV